MPIVLLPHVDHLLKGIASDDRMENLKTYFDPKPPLAPNVVDTLADFIAAASR